MYCWNLRRRIKNTDFTIISSNCWGGSVYEDLNLKYNTPTVGLFFFAPCYIKFIESLKDLMMEPLVFVEVSKYPEANQMRKLKKYPIGLIRDIEIHFLHYIDQTEAREKWIKRCSRVNYSNLYIAFTDRDLCTDENLKKFDELNFKNKIVFTAKRYDNLKTAVWLNDFEGKPFIDDIYTNRWSYRKRFDVVNWLNNGN